MKKAAKILIALFLALLMLSLWAGMVHAKNLPSYSGYVNDFADVLSEKYEKDLEQRIHNYEVKTTNEIAVVTIKSLEGETIEQYSIDLAEFWKVGKYEQDNGIIMLFAMDDRKMRIEVGQGLEGDVTDLEAKQIINQMTPFFKEAKYEEGIDKGFELLTQAIATDSAELLTNPDAPMSGVVVLIILIIIIFIILLAISPVSPLGGEGSWGYSGVWVPSSGGSDSGDGFGGGSFSGGGASGSW